MQNIASAIATARAIAKIVNGLSRAAKRPAAQPKAPLNAVVICEGCGRAPAKARCRAHNRFTCLRCGCPDCKAIRARLRAGTPRTPFSTQPPPIPVAHDVRTCTCPYCLSS